MREEGHRGGRAECLYLEVLLSAPRAHRIDAGEKQIFDRDLPPQTQFFIKAKQTNVTTYIYQIHAVATSAPQKEAD